MFDFPVTLTGEWSAIFVTCSLTVLQIDTNMKQTIITPQSKPSDVLGAIPIPAGTFPNINSRIPFGIHSHIPSANVEKALKRLDSGLVEEQLSESRCNPRMALGGEGCDQRAFVEKTTTGELDAVMAPEVVQSAMEVARERRAPQSRFGKSSLWKPNTIQTKQERLAAKGVACLEEQVVECDAYVKYVRSRARKIFVAFGKSKADDKKSLDYLSQIARRDVGKIDPKYLSSHREQVGRPLLVREATSGKFLNAIGKLNDVRSERGLDPLPVRTFTWNDLFSPRHDMHRAGVDHVDSAIVERSVEHRFVYSVSELEILVPSFFSAIARSCAGRVASVLIQNLQYEAAHHAGDVIEMVRRIRKMIRRYVSKNGSKKVHWKSDFTAAIHGALNRYDRNVRVDCRERARQRAEKVARRLEEQGDVVVSLSSTYYDEPHSDDEQNESVLQEQGLLDNLRVTHKLDADTGALIQSLKEQVSHLVSEGLNIKHSLCLSQVDIVAWPVDMIGRLSLLAAQIVQATSWSEVVTDVLAFMSHYVSIGPMFQWLQEGAVWLAQFLYSYIVPSDEPPESKVLEEQSFADILDASTIDQFSYSIQKWGRVAAGINQLQRLLEPLVVKLTKVFYEYVGVGNGSLIDEQHPEVAKWLRELELLAARGGVGLLATDPVIANEHSGILARGYALMGAFYASRPSKEAVQMYNTALRYAKELDSAATGSVKNRRQVPVCVYIHGGPGIGKSTILNLLVDAVCKKRGIVDPGMQIYRPAAQSDYWEGYNQQAFVWLDDVFQSTAIEDNRRTAMTIVDAIGNLPFPLNMAEAGSKGKFFFNSKYVCITSNVGPTVPANTLGIISDGAFKRRLHITAELVPEPQYCDKMGRLDPLKVASAFGTQIHVDAVRFNCGGSIITFNDLVEKILECENRHQQEFCALTSDKAFTQGVPAETILDIAANDKIEVFDLPDEMAACVKMARIAQCCSKKLAYYLSDAYRVHQRMLLSVGALALGIGTLVYACARKRGVEAEAMIPSGDYRTQQFARRRVVREAVIPSGDYRTQQYARKRVPVDKIRPEGAIVELEGSDDPNALELMRGRLSAQLFRFSVFSSAGAASAHAMFITECVCNVPYHMKKRIVESEELELVGRDVHVFARDAYEIIAEDRGHDMLLLRFRDPLPGCRNIITQFVHEDDVDKISSNACLMTRMLPTRGGDAPLVFLFLRDVTAQCVTDPLESGSAPLLQHGFAYRSAQTQVGDCGSPLVLLNKYVQSKILGFHYAGYKGSSGGFASIITQQFLQKHMGLVKPTFATHVLEHQSADDTVDVVEACNGFDVLGLVPANMAPHSVLETSIRKSPLYESLSVLWGPAKTAPAQLKIANGINPMELAQRKYFDPPIFYSMSWDLLSRIEDVVYRQYASHIRTGRKLRVFSLDESLNGVAEVENTRRLNMDTSSGWPWNKYKPGKKRAWIGEADDRLFIKDERLRTAIVGRVERAKRGEPTPTVWVDTLKDERRPLAKVRAGKTRLFMTGPLDFTVAFRMYFLDMQAAMMEAHLETECAVGINPHSLEWTTLWNRLNEIEGTNYIAGDFSSYDGSLPAQLIRATARIANRLYADGPENANVRETLINEVCYATHLCGRVMYRVYRGNPSGNPFTTIMNSLINTMLMLYAWVRCGWDLAEYNIHVRAVNYGDDNLLKVSNIAARDHPDVGKRAYTMRNIAFYLRELGITYTAATKDGKEFDYIDQDAVTFLKRKFAYDLESNRWFAPLDECSRDEMVYWYRARPDGDVFYQLSQQIDSHLTECAHYGRTFYDQRRSQLSDWLIQSKDMEFDDQRMPPELAGKILKSYDHVLATEFGIGH